MNRDLDYLEFLLECIKHLENYTKNVDEELEKGLGNHTKRHSPFKNKS